MEEEFLNLKDIIPQLQPLREDEYEKNGFPYCKKCHTPRFCSIEYCGEPPFITRAMCFCEEQEFKKRENELLKQKRKEEFRERQKLSMIGNKYLDANIDTAIITPNNEQAYKSARTYINKADIVIKENIGLYIYGDNSSGKTYLSACICNGLVEKGYSCEFTSIPKLLAETSKSIREGKISQAEIVEQLSKKSFLFIDDLGKEFIGDRNDYNYTKAEKLLLEVLNARYGNGLPTIFTSNYSLDDFAINFKLDKAIIERLNEMATRVIRLEGDNFRMKALEDKNKLAKSLGI